LNKCIEELHSKAKYFANSGITSTLDAEATVAKSDCLVTTELHNALVSAFDKLKADQAASPDWHPNSKSMVQDLVHPSMYPLVYGRTLGFQEECVGVSDAISVWSGKGAVIPKDDWKWNEERDRYRYNVGSGEVPPDYWSETYQWLPANVAFEDDGSVKFTSYINNLHPEKYGDIYHMIEKLVQTSLPMWDQCLTMTLEGGEPQGPGRIKPRFPMPQNPDVKQPSNWIPNSPNECAHVEVSEASLADVGYYQQDYEEEEEELTEYKWRFLRMPFIPEPSFNGVDYEPK
jgi:hypothetical protein